VARHRRREFKISGRETRPQMLQVAAPNEVVVLLGFDIRVGDARGMLNLCIPPRRSSRSPARELLELEPGDVLSLGRPVRQSLEVRVRGSVKFRGRLVRDGLRAGVRIDHADGGAVGREAM
jgi:flagellar motor switch protein FliM